MCPSFGFLLTDEQTGSGRGFHKTVRSKHPNNFLITPEQTPSSSPPPSFQCIYCPSLFDSRQSLSRHESMCHDKQMPFNCSHCGKGYWTASGLNLHIQTHRGRGFTCPVCDTNFKYKGNIKSHLKSQHMSAQCPVCSLVFRLGTDYNQHILNCKKKWALYLICIIWFN